MNHPATAILFVLTSSLFLQPVAAQSERTPLVPLPGIEDFTDGDGWGAGLGLGIEYESAYEGSDEFGFEVDPAGAVQWRRGDNIYYWAGEALGWRGLLAETWLLQAAVAFDEGREESDSDDGRLDGLGDSDEEVELVLQARRAFGSDWRYWLDGRVVTGDNGTLALFGMGRRFGDRSDGTGSEFGVVITYHDSDFANEDFGIDANQAAASGLDETELDGGFRSIGLNYGYRYQLAENWQIFGEALYERYRGEVTDSPIARSDYEAEIGIGVIYVF